MSQLSTTRLIGALNSVGIIIRNSLNSVGADIHNSLDKIEKCLNQSSQSVRDGEFCNQQGSLLFASMTFIMLSPFSRIKSA